MRLRGCEVAGSRGDGSQSVSRCATAKPRNLATILLFFIAATASARVVRVEVTSRTDYPLGYERIVGRVTYALDPKNPGLTPISWTG